MTRHPIRRRPRRNRTLSFEEWSILRHTVIDRDAMVVKRWMLANGRTIPRAIDQMPACPAVVMDSRQWGECWGPWGLDHVKDDPMMGQKAPDDEDHLIALCAAHDERGMKGGAQWNTGHRNEERGYLLQRRRERAAREG